MKRILFIFSLLLCLLSVPVTGFAAETDEEQVKYEDATADNMKEMLKGSIALDKISAENKESLLNWLEAENKPEEAKKLVDKIQKLQEDQEKDQESMDPYTKAKKTCDKKLNAEGANAGSGKYHPDPERPAGGPGRGKKALEGRGKAAEKVARDRTERILKR